MFRKRQAWEDEKKRRSGPPPAEAEAWQVTAAEWMERLRDNSGGEYTDMTFAGIAPPVRIRREPDNELDWDDGKHKEWIYERANLVTVGWDAGADLGAARAREVHQEVDQASRSTTRKSASQRGARRAMRPTPSATSGKSTRTADRLYRGGSSGAGASSGARTPTAAAWRWRLGGPVAGRKDLAWRNIAERGTGDRTALRLQPSARHTSACAKRDGPGARARLRHHVRRSRYPLEGHHDRPRPPVRLSGGSNLYLHADRLSRRSRDQRARQAQLRIKR